MKLDNLWYWIEFFPGIGSYFSWSHTCENFSHPRGEFQWLDLFKTIPPVKVWNLLLFSEANRENSFLDVFVSAVIQWWNTYLRRMRKNMLQVESPLGPTDFREQPQHFIKLRRILLCLFDCKNSLLLLYLNVSLFSINS